MKSNLFNLALKALLDFFSTLIISYHYPKRYTIPSKAWDAP